MKNPVQIPDAALQAAIKAIRRAEPNYTDMAIAALTAAQADFERRERECIVLTNEGTKPVDVAAVRRQAFEDYSDLLERLVSGVISVGMHDDNSTEMFDVDGASETMADAAAAIRALSAEPAQGKFNGKSEKELFEEWLLEEHLITATWNEQRNCFDEYPAHLAFSAWKAGRAALAQGGGE